MNEKLNSLYAKRCYLTYIDFIIFTGLMFFISEVSSKFFMNSLDVLVAVALNIFVPYFVYYILVPIFTKGQTIGNILTKTRMQYLGEYSVLKKVGITISRTLYSIVTLYMYRMLASPKMNSLGQLYFDEKFNTTIISENENIDNEKQSEYFYVTFPMGTFAKLFVALMIVTMLFDFIRS